MASRTVTAATVCREKTFKVRVRVLSSVNAHVSHETTEIFMHGQPS